MIRENVLLVAKEDGHSAQTMLSTYVAWIVLRAKPMQVLEKRSGKPPVTPFME